MAGMYGRPARGLTVLLGRPDRSAADHLTSILVTKRSETARTALGSSRPRWTRGTPEWAFVNLALSRNAGLLAPLLALQAVRAFSNQASDLEPPYGIEP